MAENGLWLIGLGPGGLDRMTVRARDAAVSANHRFLEGYTALLPPHELERLEEVIGPWQLMMRSMVENPDEILMLATSCKVALLVVGDPLQATTHVDLQLRCAEMGVPCEVVHGVSITTIVTGAIGLQSYRFGRQCTFTYPYGEYLPTSPLDIILSNRERGLHTLALLDLDPTGMGDGEQQPMSPTIAIDVLRQMASKIGTSIEDWVMILCSDMGTDDARIISGTANELVSITGGRIHCLVIPADLHDVEEVAVARWAV
jgi:diphthine synthase